MKKLLGLCCGLLLIGNTALAQVTTVDGVGMDKDSAVRDAMRNAVENVIGTFIDSRTLVDKSVVALDEIYAKSQGFVKNIKILREATDAAGYRVTAQIDVDTNPNSQLMDRLSMIMMLNDPRIAVVVGYHNNYTYNEQKEKYPLICEAAINDKLISLGFNHVLDSSSIRENNGKIDYKNDKTDYLVLGLLDIDTKDINLPSYKGYTNEYEYEQNVQTGLIRSFAELDVKIMRTDTQEIIGEFRVESDAIKNTQNSVENHAIKEIGIKAAEKVRGIFSRKAANIEKAIQFIVRSDDYNKVILLEKALNNMSGIRSVSIKGYDNGKAVIMVDSDFKPAQIYRTLKESSKLNVFMEKTTANSMELSIS